MIISSDIFNVSTLNVEGDIEFKFSNTSISNIYSNSSITLDNSWLDIRNGIINGNIESKYTTDELHIRGNLVVNGDIRIGDNSTLEIHESASLKANTIIRNNIGDNLGVSIINNGSLLLDKPMDI